MQEITEKTKEKIIKNFSDLEAIIKTAKGTIFENATESLEKKFFKYIQMSAGVIKDVYTVVCFDEDGTIRGYGNKQTIAERISFQPACNIKISRESIAVKKAILFEYVPLVVIKDIISLFNPNTFFGEALGKEYKNESFTFEGNEEEYIAKLTSLSKKLSKEDVNQLVDLYRKCKSADEIAAPAYMAKYNEKLLSLVRSGPSPSDKS